MWIICCDDSVPHHLKHRRADIPGKFRQEWNERNNAARIRYGLEAVTDYRENENGEWILSINEKGRELLRWYRDK